VCGRSSAEDVVAEDVALEAEADAGREVGGVENEAAAFWKLFEQLFLVEPIIEAVGQKMRAGARAGDTPEVEDQLPDK
jgi:hypothetical protein